MNELAQYIGNPIKTMFKSEFQSAQSVQLYNELMGTDLDVWDDIEEMEASDFRDSEDDK